MTLNYKISKSNKISFIKIGLPMASEYYFEKKVGLTQEVIGKF
jgi:hypothetical protein